MSDTEPTVIDYIRAHQILYYVTARPVLQDREYDLFCRWTLMDDGKGGSDRIDDYTALQCHLAKAIQLGDCPALPVCYPESP
jgi:hypothetical protein